MTLLLLVPFLLIALRIRLDDGGPVFFRPVSYPIIRVFP
jgi:lipopolysaccharide/colanic/teichoic acid biosynthesis glycosyltransferase